MLLVFFGLMNLAQAQPGRGGDPGAMADRFFGMMDRNRDGRLDDEEVRRMPGPMRDAMQRMGADFRRGLSRDRFAEIMPRAMEEMRRSRESGGGFGGPPGGGYGDRGRGDDRDRDRDSRYGDRDRGGYGDRGDDRGRDDYRSRYDDRSRDSRYSSSSRGDSRGRSSRRTPEPPPRVTMDLPESWKVADLDQDGQIGLYEWDRKKYAEFFALDTNHDSLLTPREISRASGATPAPNTSMTVPASPAGRVVANGGSRPGTAAVSTRSASVPSASSGAPLAPAEYDPSSAEGRWAKYVFGKLDKNKDGSLSQDEWNSSAKTRASFEKYNASITFPATLESFAGLMVAVQLAERKK